MVDTREDGALEMVSGAWLRRWSPAPLAQRWMEVRRLRAACVRTRSVVLTYDDGPGKVLTPKVLELLATHGVHATFFLLGSRAVAHRDIAQRIVDEGHEVGCHTHDHLSAWRVPSATAVADIERGYQSLRQWVRDDGLFRPPHGKVTSATRQALQRRGATVGWWTVDSGDTAEVLPDATIAASHIVRAQGGVVLLHDFDRDESDEENEQRAAFVLASTIAVLDAVQHQGFVVRTLGSVLEVVERSGHG